MNQKETNSIKSKKTPLLYWQSIIGKPEELNLFRNALEKLCNGLYTEVCLEKLTTKKSNKTHVIYSIRVQKTKDNSSTRLLLTTIKIKDKSHILLLEVVKAHDYHKAKYLNYSIFKSHVSQYQDLENEHDILNQGFETIQPNDSILELFLATNEQCFSPLTSYGDQMIQLTTEQDHSFYTQLPCKVEGPPGSGKSIIGRQIAIHALENAKRCGHILVVAENENLRNEWINSFNTSFEHTNRFNILIKTWRDLVRENIGDDIAIVSEYYGQDWVFDYLKNQTKSESNQKNNKTKKNVIPHQIKQLREQAKQYIDEFKICSGLSLNEYQKLGKNLTLLDIRERTQVYKTFLAYKDALNQKKQVDLQCFKLHLETAQCYFHKMDQHPSEEELTQYKKQFYILTQNEFIFYNPNATFKKYHLLTDDQQQLQFLHEKCSKIPSETRLSPQAMEIIYQCTGFHPNAFDLTIIEEAQDFPPSVLRSLNECSTKNVVYLTDSQQILWSTRSNHPFIDELCTVKNQVNHITLSSSLRCPRKVAEFANGWLFIKHHFTGGTNHKGEKTRIELSDFQKEHEGELYWIDKDKQTLWNKKLLEAAQHTDFAITAPEELIEEARKKFSTPLVFTARNIKGLQYRKILDYRPLDDKALRDLVNNPSFQKKIDTIPEKIDPKKTFHKKNQTSQENHIFAPYFTSHFVSSSRAMDVLFIYQPVIPHYFQRPGNLLKNQVDIINHVPVSPNNIEPSKNNINREESISAASEYSRQDWEQELNRLKKIGGYEQQVQWIEEKLKTMQGQKETELDMPQQDLSLQAPQNESEKTIPPVRQKPSPPPLKEISSKQTREIMTHLHQAITLSSYTSLIKKLKTDQNYISTFKNINFFDLEFTFENYGNRSLFIAILISMGPTKQCFEFFNLLEQINPNFFLPLKETKKNILFDEDIGLIMKGKISLFHTLILTALISPNDTKAILLIEKIIKINPKLCQYFNVNMLNKTISKEILSQIIKSNPTFCKNFKISPEFLAQETLKEFSHQGKDLLFLTILLSRNNTNIISLLMKHSPNFFVNMTTVDFYYELCDRSLYSLFFDSLKNSDETLENLLNTNPNLLQIRTSHHFEIILPLLIQGGEKKYNALYGLLLSDIGSIGRLSHYILYNKNFNMHLALKSLYQTSSGKKIIFLISHIDILKNNKCFQNVYVQLEECTLSQKNDIAYWIKKILNFQMKSKLQDGKIGIELELDLDTHAVNEFYHHITQSIDQIDLTALIQDTLYLETISVLHYQDKIKLNWKPLPCGLFVFLFNLLSFDDLLESKKIDLSLLKQVIKAISGKLNSTSLFSKSTPESYSYFDILVSIKSEYPLIDEIFLYNPKLLEHITYDILVPDPKNIMTSHLWQLTKNPKLHNFLHRLFSQPRLAQSINSRTLFSPINIQHTFFLYHNTQIPQNSQSDQSPNLFTHPLMPKIEDNLIIFHQNTLYCMFKKNSTLTQSYLISSEVLEKNVDLIQEIQLLNPDELVLPTEKIKKLLPMHLPERSIKTYGLTNLFRYLVTESDEGLQVIASILEHHLEIMTDLNSLNLNTSHENLKPRKPNSTLYFLARHPTGRSILSKIAMKKPSLFQKITYDTFYDENEQKESVFSFLTEPDAIEILEAIISFNPHLIEEASLSPFVSITVLQNQDQQETFQHKIKPAFENLLKTEKGSKILLFYNTSPRFQNEIEQYKLIPFISQELQKTEHGQHIINKIIDTIQRCRQKTIGEHLFFPQQKPENKTEDHKVECILF